ncbi:Prominin-1-A [Nibea albiflora]|uniref:Prominin-1-A n=1 Tax=Nibea albiflora TaxID=240163 RepID=A0ACB7FK59_NIBAL|nr:Prominin-1-A [Nibea albiflora]
MLWTQWLVLLLCWGATGSEQQADDRERDRLPADARVDSRRQRSPPPVEPLDFGFVPAAVYDTHAYYEPGPVGILFHMVHAFLYVVQPNTFPKGVRILEEDEVWLVQLTMTLPKRTLHLIKVSNNDRVKWIYYEAGFLICSTVGIVFVILTPIIGMCFCMCRCCENCGGEMHQRQKKNADCQRGFYTASLIATSVFIIVGVLIAYAANHNVSAQIKSTRRFINTNMRDLKTFANNTPAQIEYLTAQYTTAKNKVLSELDNIGPLLGGRIQSQLEKEVVPSLDSALRMAGAMRETKEALENISSSLEVLQEGTGKLQANLAAERASLSNTLSDPACTNGAVSHTCNTIRSTLSQLGINADFSKLHDVNHALDNVNTVLRTDLSNIVQKGYSSFNDTPRLVKEQTKNIVSGVKGMLDKIGTEINGFSKMFPVEASLANFTIFLNQGQKKIESYYPQIDQMDFYRWIGCVTALCIVVLVLAFNILGLMCGTCGYDKQATPTTRGCLSNTGGNLLMAECYENNGLYHALQLETMFNINSFLNKTVYNNDLAKVLESVNVNLQDITLLEQAGRDNLINFANSGVNKGVTLVDLLSFSTDLEAQADQLPRGALENALKGHASSIRQIHREQVVSMEQAMVKVTNILSAIDAAEYLITHNASHVVKQETKGYIQSLVGYFKQYTDWVRNSLTAEVAQCKPISNIVDSMEIVGCSFIIDSVNTFWFGLGGCCILLIPSIIFSVKLAKYYRRMDTEDVFEDVGNTGNHGEQVYDIHGDLAVVSTKTKDSCTMVVSGAGDYTRLRVSCKGQSQGQTPGRSYYCDFQGKPNLCRAYNLNPRHYFTQMMWDMRKLSHACQGQKIYRPSMCKKYPDDAQMTFLASWPKTTTPKPSKPVQEPRKPVVPAQTKPVTTPKPVKPQPQPVKPQPGKGPQVKKTTPKPKTTTRPTEQPDSKASRIASEYCWKSFHGVCTYFISWFQN